MKLLDADETHVIWSADLAPRLQIMPSDTIEVQTSLGSGARYLQSATPDDIREVTAASPGLSLTGPIFVEGAKPGDVLGIELCAIAIASWGYTTVAPGFGLLADEFPEPEFRSWDLSRGDSARFNDDIVVQLHPFVGTVGVAPPPGQVLPTIPPTRWGGTLISGDSRQAQPSSSPLPPRALCFRSEMLTVPRAMARALSKQIGLSLERAIHSLRRCAIPSAASTARLR